LPFMLKRFNEITLLSFGLLILTVGLYLIPLSLHLFILLFCLACISVGNSLINPTIQAIASENVASHEYGKSLGFLQSGGSIGRIMGPIIGGELFYALGSGAPFVFAGLVTTLLFFYSVLKLNSPNTLLEKLRQKIIR